ncbi:hypothetical protein [Cohnella sp. 56]|uniref:hypothetical protein n=1 Tax=Cohnella sp. 56 TaxID=3113722 RepID=UPI0030E755A4
MMKLIRTCMPLIIGVIGLTIIAGCTKGNSVDLASPTSFAPPVTARATLPNSPAASNEPEATLAPPSIPSNHDVENAPTITPDTVPTPSKGGSSDSHEPLQSPTNPPKPSPSNIKERTAIGNKYDSKFSAIQSTCKAKVSNLTSEVTSYIAGAKASDGEVSIADLQKQFLGKVVAAEGSCDQQFNSTLAQAEQAYKDAGIVETQIDSWKRQYESGKSKARVTAMSKILAAWNAEY